VRHRTGIAGAVLTVATLAVVAACGGGSKGTGTDAAPAGDYLTCLRQHGVNLPQVSFSPGARPSGVRPSGQRPTGPRPSGSRSPGAFGGGFGGGGFGGFLGSQAPPGVDQNTWNQAQQACASLRPTAFPSRNRDAGAITAYRNCLADHGVTLTGRPDDLSTADPKVAAAIQACAPLRPTPRPSPTPSG
jgi:hypothetical protein